jgi:hypothetical protein
MSHQRGREGEGGKEEGVRVEEEEVCSKYVITTTTGSTSRKEKGRDTNETTGADFAKQQEDLQSVSSASSRPSIGAFSEGVDPRKRPRLAVEGRDDPRHPDVPAHRFAPWTATQHPSLTVGDEMKLVPALLVVV